MSENSKTSSGGSSTIVLRIARALGVSADAFYGEADDGVSDFLTLVRLWSAISDGHGRSRVLALARQEAGRCASGEAA